jgi:5-methylcytosine-specific restriction endonuclease McrA
MACRQTQYASKMKRVLIELLGGRCALCPEDDPDKLEFDHINGRDYEPRQLSYSARLAKYKREAAAGKLRLLCGPCNREARKKNDNGAWVPTAAVIETTAEIFGDAGEG